MKKSLIFPLLLLPLLLEASLFSEAMRAYKQGHYKEAKTLFENAIEEDGAEQARFFLGLLYLQGQGVKKNLQKARQYLKQAADLGNARAMCYLAESYLVEKPPRKKMATKLLKEGQNDGADECRTIASKYKISL